MRKPTQQEYFLAEAVIETTYMIDTFHPDFRPTFEDSRMFNTLVTDWAVEYLDWFEAADARGEEIIYLIELEKFIDKKIDEYEHPEYTPLVYIN